MKRWIKNLCIFIEIISPLTISLLGIFLKDIHFWWIILLLLLLLLFSLCICINHFLPTYSSKKFLKCLYIKNFIGKYTAKLNFRTYNQDTKELLNLPHEVAFEIKFNGANIIKIQKTKNSASQSTSELLWKTANKDFIIMYFVFKQNGHYNDKLIPQDGHELIQYNISEKKIESNIYFTDKPSYGKLQNIKKIKIKSLAKK